MYLRELVKPTQPSQQHRYATGWNKSIDAFATQLLQKQESGLTPPFPLVVYYGTNRGILGEVQRRRNFKKKFQLLDALDGALEPTARFKAAFEWFNAMEDEERGKKKKKRL